MLPRLLAITFLLGLLMVLPAAEALAQETVDDVDPRRDGTGNTFYGVNFIFPEEPWLSLGQQSGAGVVRWQFNWRDHEPEPGAWDWEEADEFIETWLDNGIAVHALLHNPPDWAKENPGTGLVPTNRDLPWDHPDNGWGRYCYEFANRYKGKIHSYEIWNEPDLNQFWEGTAEEYFHIMRSCYMAIKAADPEPPVAMAGMALLIEPDFFPTVVQLAAADPNGQANNYYFDVANIHMYNYPELVYDLTGQTRWVLQQNGMGDKPIWITETNIAVRGYGRNPDIARWWAATEEEVGWYMLQSIANAYAAGAEKFMVFRLNDHDMDQGFGLVRNSGTPRPAYGAIQLASTLLRDIVEVDRQSDGDLVVVRMRRADGVRLVLAFTKSGQASEIVVAAEQPAGVLINAEGSSRGIRPNAEGMYEVPLPSATGRDFSQPENYTVGSPPVILMEGGDQAAPAAALSAEQISDFSFSLTWSGDDGDFGTGVLSYDIEISRDLGATWEPWLVDTRSSETVFDVPEGGYYQFRVRATDWIGNLGAFSETVEVGIKPVGYLTGYIVDLRGQRVPVSRLMLGDGLLFDAGENGVLRAELPLGTVTLASIDGGAHGVIYPDEQLDIGLAQEIVRTWLLIPRENPVTDYGFDAGGAGWGVSSPVDASVVTRDGSTVMQLRAQRRPWGYPDAYTTITLPEGAQGVVSFFYRMPQPGGVFQLRATSPTGSDILWRTTEESQEFVRVWADLTPYAGQPVTLHFELIGRAGTAEFDQVIVGDIPILDQ